MIKEQGRPLDPSRYFFYGFGEHLATLEDVFRGLRMFVGDPKVVFAEDALYFPDRQEPESLESTGGIADSLGWLITDSKGRRRHPRKRQFTCNPQYELDESVAYLGPLYNHYGHFLLETLARTWVLNQIEPSIRVLFHGSSHRGIGPTALGILEKFGVPQERILILGEATRVRSAIVPEPLYRLLKSVHRRAAEPYREVAERIMAGGVAQPSEQPVYLSRRLLPADKREVVGEAELEEVLRENGFRIAHPETMTFEDQVRLFNQHADFFASDGSTVHNVLFSLGSPRLHVLTGSGAARASYLSDCFLVAAAASASVTFVNCLGRDERELPERNRRHYPDLLEMERVFAYLNQSGYLKKRSRAVLASHSPSLRQQFHESWLCTRLRLTNAGNQELPADELLEASELSARSWPVSLMLASYFLRRNPACVDGFLRLFAVLLEAESETGRLARFRPDVDELMKLEGLEMACSSETNSLVAAAIAERLPSEDVADHESERLEIGQFERASGGRPVLIAGLSRTGILKLLPKGGTIAEVGVFRGDFASRIRKMVKPETLHLIDPWELTSGSGPGEGELNPEAEALVRSRFCEDIETGRVVVHRSYSTTIAPTFPDSAFDWVYIDAMHDYQNVLADLLAFKAKVKRDGFILGHDFSNSPMSRGRNFGVVEAVLEFTRREDFELRLVTNDGHPSYLLARSENTTTWPALRAAVICGAPGTSVEVDASHFGRFEIVGVPGPDGAAQRIIRIG